MSTATDTPTPTTLLSSMTSDDVCHEDEPCWDCSTMGNLVCGPVEASPLVAQSAPPLPALPSTGFDPHFAFAALILVIGGALLRHLAR